MELKELAVLREFYYRVDGCMEVDTLDDDVKMITIKRFKKETDKKMKKLSNKKALCKGQ